MMRVSIVKNRSTGVFDVFIDDTNFGTFDRLPMNSNFSYFSKRNDQLTGDHLIAIGKELNKINQEKPKNLVIVSWDSCPECGDSVGFESKSMCGEFNDEKVYDGETAYCISCDQTGSMSVSDESSYINWN